MGQGMDTLFAPETTREALLVEVARGNHVAFEDLYDRVAGKVHGVVQRCLVDPAQTEEVTQEVFLEIWQTAARYSPAKGAALTWILTMAHRRAVDRVRSSQSSRDRDLRLGISRVEIDYDQVWESAEIRLEHNRARAAMDSLTRLQREAVSLAYLEGYTPTELAGLLNISVGTAKARLRDGLTRLRIAMEYTAA
jgi:RNA polymerase sigma-70 factor (ECF subfamily)